MGHVPPAPPRMPPAPAVPLNLRNFEHLRAWAEFEAEREVDALCSGDVHEKLPVDSLEFYARRVRVKSVMRGGSGAQIRPYIRPILPPPARLI